MSLQAAHKWDDTYFQAPKLRQPVAREPLKRLRPIAGVCQNYSIRLLALHLRLELVFLPGRRTPQKTTMPVSMKHPSTCTACNCCDIRTKHTLKEAQFPQRKQFNRFSHPKKERNYAGLGTDDPRKQRGNFYRVMSTGETWTTYRRW